MTATSNRSSAPVLLVHGLFGSLEYTAQICHAARMSCHAIDLLGYGAHKMAAPDSTTLDRQATHFLNLVEARGSKPSWWLGHSMGGTVVMLAADRRPDLVRGIINVEGNFTRKDAFWSREIAEMGEVRWGSRYREMQADVPGWLTGCDIEPTPDRVMQARRLLYHQPAETVFAMAKALVTETCQPEYIASIHRVAESGIEIHLIAGERSEHHWDVPAFVKTTATSFGVVRGAGHMMMLEQPIAFCELVKDIVGEAS